MDPAEMQAQMAQAQAAMSSMSFDQLRSQFAMLLLPSAPPDPVIGTSADTGSAEASGIASEGSSASAAPLALSPGLQSQGQVQLSSATVTSAPAKSAPANAPGPEPVTAASPAAQQHALAAVSDTEQSPCDAMGRPIILDGVSRGAPPTAAQIWRSYEGFRAALAGCDEISADDRDEISAAMADLEAALEADIGATGRAQGGGKAEGAPVDATGTVLSGSSPKRGAARPRPSRCERLGSAAALDMNSIPDISKALCDGHEASQTEAARAVRTLLSIEHKPPIQEVIDAGMVPRLIELLTKSQAPTLQFEAVWALTNIVSGTSEQTAACVKEGIVPKMTELLSSPSDDVREQAVWALGNIAGDSTKMRDEVLKHHALTTLLRQLDPNTTPVSMLRNATWTLSNLCRGTPKPPFALVKPALPTLASLICSNDVEVLGDACWALSYLSDDTNEKIQAVIDAGVCRRLVELLVHQSARVSTPALKVVGNLVTGEEAQTQAVIDCGALPCLAKLLSHDKKDVRKEACFALSNITAGNKEQLQAVIDHKIVPVLARMLETEDLDVRKECAWAISNATAGSDDLQIKFLVDSGCVPALVNLLDKTSDVSIISVALEGIHNILKCGQRVDGPVAAVEMCGGEHKIADLQQHENHKICDMAVRILEALPKRSQFTAAHWQTGKAELVDDAFPVGSRVHVKYDRYGTVQGKAAHGRLAVLLDEDDGGAEITVAPERLERVCSGCSGVFEKLLACSRCKAAYFCTQACLRASWKSHRAVCARSRPSAQAAAKLPTGWYDANDSTSGKTYYYTAGGAVQWALPTEEAASPVKAAHGAPATPTVLYTAE